MSDSAPEPGAEPEGVNDVPSDQATAAKENPASETNPAIRQLESILQNLTTYAKPVLREIAARAAEVAAKAGAAAGPAAQRAASITEDVGVRLAAKGREVASELRSDQGSEPMDPAKSADTSASQGTDSPP